MLKRKGVSTSVSGQVIGANNSSLSKQRITFAGKQPVQDNLFPEQ